MCLALGAMPASAQSASAAPNAAEASATSSPESQAAHALFEQATQLMEKGQVAEACERYRASNELEAGVGTLLRLGNCYEQVRRFASALGAFELAAETATTRGDAERADVAKIRAAALRPRIAKLVVQVDAKTSALPGLRLTVAGRPLAAGDWGKPQLLDEGQYVVEAIAPGYQPWNRSINLQNDAASPGVVSVEAMLPLEVFKPSSVAGTGVEGAPTGASKLPWIVGGVGVGVLALSGVLALVADNRNERSEAQCRSGDATSCNPEGVSLRSDARRLAGTATAVGIVGLAGVAAGGVLYFVTTPAVSNRETTGLLLRFERPF